MLPILSSIELCGSDKRTCLRVDTQSPWEFDMVITTGSMDLIPIIMYPWILDDLDSILERYHIWFTFIIHVFSSTGARTGKRYRNDRKDWCFLRSMLST